MCVNQSSSVRLSNQFSTVLIRIVTTYSDVEELGLDLPELPFIRRPTELATEPNRTPSTLASSALSPMLFCIAGRLRDGITKNVHCSGSP